MDWTGCEVVEVVRGKVSGVPILKGSRVQADAVLEIFLTFDLNRRQGVPPSAVQLLEQMVVPH
jgi:hypothetical protein